MDSLDKKGIVERIKELRIEYFGDRGKCAFANELDINPSTYSFYENQRVPPIGVLLKICEYTEIELYWLLTGSGPKYRHPQKEAEKHTFVNISGGEKDAKIAVNLTKIIKKVQKFAKNDTFLQSISSFIDLLSEKEEIDEKIRTLGIEPKPLAGGLSEEQVGREEIGGREGLSVPAEDAGSKETFSKGVISGPRKRPGWIPVLGRTAAGIVYCWKDSLVPETGRAVTELDDLVSKYIGKDILSAYEGQISVDLENPELKEYLQRQQINLVQLAGTSGDEVTEFVKSDRIFKVFPDSFALRVDGDSMSPRIADNDIVILSPSVPAVQGQAAVVRIKEQIGVTCKLIREEKKEVHLIPLNEKYETKAVKKEDLLWALAVLCHIKI